MTLSHDQYLHLVPHEEIYRRVDKYEDATKSRKKQERAYTVLSQEKWTHIIHDKIQRALTQKPVFCTFMFKRAKIYPTSSDAFAKIFGYCSECKTSLFGYIESPPADCNDAITINFECKGNFTKPHTLYKKRPLSGTKRTDTAHKLLKENLSATEYCRKQASKGVFGKTQNTGLSTPNVLRTAKHEARKSGWLDQDPVLSICKAKVHPAYKGAVRKIGVSPFFVHYWTNVQIHVYNRFSGKNCGEINIDATGDVVEHIWRKI